jgi:hypothetical protein
MTLAPKIGDKIFFRHEADSIKELRRCEIKFINEEVIQVSLPSVFSNDFFLFHAIFPLNECMPYFKR